jgi:hypothetical protein
MSTRDVPGDKGGRCVRLTTYYHIVPMLRNLEALTLLEPSGPAWPVMGVLYLYLLCGTYGERRGAYRVSVVNFRERDHLEVLGVHWRIILK